jgi:hypothetical protein
MFPPLAPRDAFDAEGGEMEIIYTQRGERERPTDAILLCVYEWAMGWVCAFVLARLHVGRGVQVSHWQIRLHQRERKEEKRETDSHLPAASQRSGRTDGRLLTAHMGCCVQSTTHIIYAHCVAHLSASNCTTLSIIIRIEFDRALHLCDYENFIVPLQWHVSLLAWSQPTREMCVTCFVHKLCALDFDASLFKS